MATVTDPRAEVLPAHLYLATVIKKRDAHEGIRPRRAPMIIRCRRPQVGEFHTGTASAREETVPLSSRVNSARLAGITSNMPDGECGGILAVRQAEPRPHFVGVGPCQEPAFRRRMRPRPEPFGSSRLG